MQKLNILLSGLSEKEFYNGAIENINPDLSVSDQAHLLPFQKATWEFPRQNLKLGKKFNGIVIQTNLFTHNQKNDWQP